MAKYKVQIGRSAEKALTRLPKEALKRVLQKILSLADDPFPPGSRKLSGVEDAWRIRVGSYRVVYDVYQKMVAVRVLKIGHRKDVYR